MKKSQLLFLNAFSIKDAFSINDVFFLWISATLDVSLVRREGVTVSSFWWCPAAAQIRERGDCGDPTSGLERAVIPRLC